MAEECRFGQGNVFILVRLSIGTHVRWCLCIFTNPVTPVARAEWDLRILVIIFLLKTEHVGKSYNLNAYISNRSWTGAKIKGKWKITKCILMFLHCRCFIEIHLSCTGGS